MSGGRVRTDLLLLDAQDAAAAARRCQRQTHPEGLRGWPAERARVVARHLRIAAANAVAAAGALEAHAKKETDSP